MSGQRYLFLDALRGIAALLVAWHHSAKRIPLRWPDAPSDGAVLGTLAETLNFGAAGVVTFFLISGFVIPSSLGRPEPGALKGFAIRRFLRLYPAFWLSVAQAAALGFVVAGALPPLERLAANLTMAAGFFGQAHLQGQYWTLQMELVFYALCALLFRFGRLQDGRTLRDLSLGLSAVFLVVWIPFHRRALGEPDPDFVYLPFILALMLIGALCRRAYDAHGGPAGLLRGPDARRLWTAAVPWLAFPLAWAALPFAEDPLMAASGAVPFGVGHLLGVALFAAGLAGLRKKPSRILLFLGLISYSIYLFHGMAIDFTVWAVEDSGLELLRGRGFRFYLGMMLLLAVGIAAGTYYCVERPFIALGRRLTGRTPVSTR